IVLHPHSPIPRIFSQCISYFMSGSRIYIKRRFQEATAGLCVLLALLYDYVYCTTKISGVLFEKLFKVLNPISFQLTDAF
ncbi:MAG: hypothetical protein KAH86_10655, partial [Methanosarcinales archaeon]|nr:hypothetical protein [Methanosarcinales archaeon]